MNSITDGDKTVIDGEIVDEGENKIDRETADRDATGGDAGSDRGARGGSTL